MLLRYPDYYTEYQLKALRPCGSHPWQIVGCVREARSPKAKTGFSLIRREGVMVLCGLLESDTYAFYVKQNDALCMKSRVPPIEVGRNKSGSRLWRSDSGTKRCSHAGVA